MTALINEQAHLSQWLVAFLEGDATLMAEISGVYEDVVPGDASLPAVRFQFRPPATDVMVVDGIRIMSRMTYLVVAMSNDPSPAVLVPIADRLDALLHRAVGSTSTIQVLSSIRLAPFRLTEPVEQGRYYRYAGGMYQFQVQAL